MDDGPEVGQDNLAFISYSAGTTGKPKGIANPHRAPVLSYLWRFGISDYQPGDRVGCNVFFIWEMMRPLLRGATTVVIPDDVIYDPNALIRFIEEYEITETLITPSLLETVLNSSGPDLGERLSNLKTLWLNGEVVTRTLARRAMEVLPNARLLNVYSCSETHEVAAGDLGELVENQESTYCAVGVPMDRDHLYLLDEDGEPVSEGEAGELFVGGDCLARGYVGLPEKTEESFPEDPFSPADGARMYRSGDRARILSDGTLEITGRVDFMVKIRGYSVELGAVEAAIERGPRREILRRRFGGRGGRGQAPRGLRRARPRGRRTLLRLEPRPEDGTQQGDEGHPAGQPAALRRPLRLRRAGVAPHSGYLGQGRPLRASAAPAPSRPQGDGRHSQAP